METDVGKKREFPRGGWQDDGLYYQDPDDGGYVYANPYDAVRQQEYERLHQQMQQTQPRQTQQPQAPPVAHHIPHLPTITR